MVAEIDRCRICGNPNLSPVLDLGAMALTGVFPKEPRQETEPRPLQLVRCDTRGREEACGLVQLRHTVPPGEMYTEGYGYRSGLNQSMIRHLRGIAERMKRLVPLGPQDVVVDIGSNDGTLLSSFEPGGPLLVGIDPIARQLRRHYRADVQIIPDFFSAELFRARYGHKRAKAVTSIAMFYDLASPLSFVEQVRDILDDDGVWCLEQSYLPAMIRHNAYDTVCHEHLEYYAVRPIKWMADRAGLKILDVATNDTNGGSFVVTLAKRGSPRAGPPAAVAWYLENETKLRLDEAEVWREFRRCIDEQRARLLSLLDAIRAAGQTVAGYGASTKGNVLLQYCGIGPDRLPCIAEVNEDKFGRFTPGTGIPILSEEEVRARKPDSLLVLPWHLRDAIVQREAEFLSAGGKLIFPLPVVEIVSA